MSEARKWGAGVLAVLIAAALYMIPNRAMLAAAVPLPLTALDLGVPFLPWTGWLYASPYLFLLAVFAGLRDEADVWRFLGACLFAQVIAATCFVLFPTVYPRGLFEVPADTAPLNAALVAFFRQIDAPANCLPSLHVSSTFLCAAACSRPGLERFRGPVMAAAGLLMLSTLTFKQHYVVDVGAGLVLGAIAWRLFFGSRLARESAAQSLAR